MGWEGGGGELPKWTERRSDAFGFAAHLPGEHPGFVAVAYIAIEASGRKPTKENVLERLEATGRSARQIREKGWDK